MSVDLVKYLSSVMRKDIKDHSVDRFHQDLMLDSEPEKDLAKDHFLVDSKYALGLDEVI